MLTPTSRPVKEYYNTLKTFQKEKVGHESATREAFKNLLTHASKLRNWIVIPELSQRAAGQTIRPDATVRDQNSLPRGYWEAKDTQDDLLAEIEKKKKRGYPLSNIIFEDTRIAVLYQDKAETLRADLADPQQLVELLNRFLDHREGHIDEFYAAVDEFKERVPELALGLAGKINEAHRENKKFQNAFEEFLELCQKSLNPNIRREAVDEMLVQHLLTERLIRRVFDNDDFASRNIIASEVEKVIKTLVGQAFSRTEFLKSLDRFYIAIENAAHNLNDFGEKQHFLNNIYERFFQGYCVKSADTHGIVYTPQPIVDFMCNSVVEVLKREFGMEVWNPAVRILDPCTGTGNFIVNLINRVPKSRLERVYKEQLFANEVMLMPYYIASLNIEHAYYQKMGQYESFDGICFVDTLDLAEEHQTNLFPLSAKNTERVQRQKTTPITVIIGNPPYNVGQLNENDNNKNRKYAAVEKRVRDTYAADSKATNKNALSDAYVKFIRWATDRLEGRDGIVCYVTNNSFVDQIAFDGMRKHLLQDFTTIYHIDLHGNVRQNPRLSGTTHNVFGIQVGVGITLAVRQKKATEHAIYYHRVPEDWRKEEKLAYLLQQSSAPDAELERLTPDAKNNWLTSEHDAEFQTFIPIGTKEGKRAAGKSRQEKVIFQIFSRGVATSRDDVVYDFDREKLAARVKEFIEDYNAEVDRYKRMGGKVENVDDFVKYDRIKWSRDLKLDLQRGNRGEFAEEKLRPSLFKPFCRKLLFFDRLLNEEVYVMPSMFPTRASEVENRVIVSSDIGYRATNHSTLMCAVIPELHLCASTDSHQCFPFYIYDEDGTNRRENITDWALASFRKHYKNNKINKWDVFHYVYGILHQPAYRAKFADPLKRELPRIPLAPDFQAYKTAGEQLARLHLDYEKLEPSPLERIENPDVTFTWRVEKMRLSSDKESIRINEALTLSGIPESTFDYRLGNRSALDWVIDQYQVTEDKRTGVVSDPNRPDDPQYIVRLVGQVVRVSVETVKIVNALPAEYA